MNFLEERIVRDGVVKEGNVLKVDSFLNHQMDIGLLNEMGAEFKRRFEGKPINKILTIAKLPYTVLMVAVVVVAVIASLWNTMTLMLAVPLWFLFGVSLIAWVNSYLLRRVFTVFEPEEDAQKEKEQ